MTIISLAQDPLEILVAHITDGTLKATPKGIAIIGWLCDFVATEPHIAEIISSGDGMLLARHSDDVGANEFLGPRKAFLNQIRLACRNAELTDKQIEKVIGIAERKLGD